MKPNPKFEYVSYLIPPLKVCSPIITTKVHSAPSEKSLVTITDNALISIRDQAKIAQQIRGGEITS
jgi:hypothetical protein